MILKAFDNKYFKELKKLRKRNILFFNGCFDIIHPGHLQMLNEIKHYAKVNNYEIVCGLNSDKSVKLQNKSHPLINNEKDRALFLEKLGINFVIIFDEKDPSALIMSLTPDLVFKGKDYMNIDYPEKDFLYIIDAKIKYVELEKGYSTTHIYNKVKSYILDEIKERLDEA
jgi:rfaE bifunctional protein nucleotidyltransferase chain/domain